ncbi:hypothetical protein D3C72_2232810 [compost metagenome]
MAISPSSASVSVRGAITGASLTDCTTKASVAAVSAIPSLTVKLIASLPWWFAAGR